MKIKSFVKNGWQLIPIEVEVTLVSGIPQIQVMGLADRLVKESTLRMKSALKNQGFEFPRTKQILVHLKPSHIKKSSCGVDLAMAVAILFETKQIDLPINENTYFYGELSLKGEVSAPDDLTAITDDQSETVLITGRCLIPCRGTVFSISTLSDLTSGNLQVAQKLDLESQWRKPVIDQNLKFTKLQARLMSIIGAGEHSCLLAGPAGSGKSTLARSVWPLLRDPNVKVFAESRLLYKYFGANLPWRPLVIPHHTTPTLSMIGGGIVPKPGEISRAHGGVLLLDELLEFDCKVQEAMREPFEEGKITVSRSGKCQVFPAQALILATTNLCPCGEWAPGHIENCHCSGTKLRQYFGRLSGPLVDRFALIGFSHLWNEKKDINAGSVCVRIYEAQIFNKKMFADEKLNSFRDIGILESTMSKVTKIFWSELKKQNLSLRRLQKCLQVARTIADIERSTEIEIDHMQEAYSYSIQPFLELQKGI